MNDDNVTKLYECVIGGLDLPKASSMRHRDDVRKVVNFLKRYHVYRAKNEDCVNTSLIETYTYFVCQSLGSAYNWGYYLSQKEYFLDQLNNIDVMMQSIADALDTLHVAIMKSGCAGKDIKVRVDDMLIFQHTSDAEVHYTYLPLAIPNPIAPLFYIKVSPNKKLKFTLLIYINEDLLACYHWTVGQKQDDGLKADIIEKLQTIVGVNN